MNPSNDPSELANQETGNGDWEMALYIIWPKDIPDEKNRVLYQIINSLSETNEVKLFTLRDSSIPVEIQNKVLLHRMPEVRGDTVKYFNALFFRIWCFLSISRMVILDRSQVRIVYSFSQSSSFLLGFILAKLANAKWVLHVMHSPYYHRDYGKVTGNLIQSARGSLEILIAKSVFKYADLIFATSHSRNDGAARILIEEFMVPPDRVIPLQQGIDLELAKPESRNDISLAKSLSRSSKKEVSFQAIRAGSSEGRATVLSVDMKKEDRFRVFYVGGISRVKASDLIRSAEELQRVIPNVDVILAGPVANSFKEEFVRLVESKSEVLSYLGRIHHSDALSNIADADVCICTLTPWLRDYEFAQPVKILEYLAMGKAVVATNLEGIRGIIEDEYNGLLYPPGEIDILVRKIKSIHDDKKLRERLEAAARESVLRFDWGVLNRRAEERLRAAVESRGI